VLVFVSILLHYSDILRRTPGGRGAKSVILFTLKKLNFLYYHFMLFIW
jgi:hypothetical protein